MSRTGREIHYPKQVDSLDPYILLVHQGMIEDIFLEDLKERGVEVTRSSPFVKCSSAKGLVESICEDTEKGVNRTIKSKYVVGCDGAHSKVRKSISGIEMVGESGKAAWGVLDGNCS
jgi:phenol 2-monooxygenase